MNMRPNCCSLKAKTRALALAGLVSFPNLHGDGAAPVTTPAAPDITQAAAGQEEVRDGAKKVNDNLQTIVDEMKQNGLSDTQTAALLQTSDKLDSLNEQDMQKIIDLIKSVRAMPQENDQQTTLLNACQQQKSVSTQLKGLALELSRQASMEAIIRQLEGLIVRQSENLRETERLRKLEGQPMVRYDVQNRLVNRVSTEQNAIARDTTILGQELTAAPPADSADAPAEAPDAAGLQNDAAQAANQTGNGPLYAALSNQAHLKDKLLQTLAIWKARQDMETRLQQARAQVEGLLKEQTSLATLTARNNRGNDDLAERQAKVGDHAELAQDIARLNAAAGAQIEQAQAQIRQSANALSPASNITEARPAQASTIAALSNAAKLLAQQADALDAKKNEPLPDMMKDLRGLKMDIDQAQQAAHDKPDPALADQVAKLQQEAAPLSSQAADKLDDAAGKLQQAQPDSKAAAEKLADASKAVQQQIEALAQPAKEYDALAKASDLLKEAVQKASDADASLKDRGHPDKDRVAGDLATAQGDLDQLDSTVGAHSPEAHQTIQQAGGELKAGGLASGQGDQPGGQGHVEAGLKILEDAQSKMAQAQQSAQQKGMAAIGKGQTGAQRMARNKNRNPPEARYNDQDRKAQDTGLLDSARDLPATGAAQVVGALSPKDRDALIQFEAEKAPPEYAPMVQQYMKNLSDSSSP